MTDKFQGRFNACGVERNYPSRNYAGNQVIECKKHEKSRNGTKAIHSFDKINSASDLGNNSFLERKKINTESNSRHYLK